MKPPEKKPLVRREDQGKVSYKAANKKNIEPIKALNEFQEVDMDSFCWESYTSQVAVDSSLHQWE